MLKFSKNALSLVALLVVLTTLSVAMALLIPVMTKKQAKIDTSALSKKNGGYYICYRNGDNLYEYRADIINGVSKDAIILRKVTTCNFKSPNDVQEFKVITIGAGGGGAASNVLGGILNLTSCKNLTFGKNKTVLKDPFDSYAFDWTKTAFSAFLRNLKLTYTVEGGAGASSDTWVDMTSGETRYAVGEKGGICQLQVNSPAINSVYEYQSGSGAAYQSCAVASMTVAGGAEGYFKTSSGTTYASGGASAQCSATLGQSTNAYVLANHGRGICSNIANNKARTDAYNCDKSCGNYVSEGSALQPAKTSGSAGAQPAINICHTFPGYGEKCVTGPVNIQLCLKNFVMEYYDAMGGEAGEVVIRTIPFLKDFSVGKASANGALGLGKGGIGGELNIASATDGWSTKLSLSSLGSTYQISAKGGEAGKRVKNSKKNIDDFNVTNDIIPAGSYPGHDGSQTSVNIPAKAGTFTSGTGNDCNNLLTKNGTSATLPGAGGGGGCMVHNEVKYAGYSIWPAGLGSASSFLFGYDKNGAVIPLATLNATIASGGAGAGGAVIVEW